MAQVGPISLCTGRNIFVDGIHCGLEPRSALVALFCVMCASGLFMRSFNMNFDGFARFLLVEHLWHPGVAFS